MLLDHYRKVSRRQASARGLLQEGFTVVELLVAMVVTILIMGTVAAAFITGVRTTDGLNENASYTSDINLISTYFAPDVMSMAGPTYDPASATPDTPVSPDGWQTPIAEGGAVCGPGTLGDSGLYSFNSKWNATDKMFDHTVTYRATGSGDDAEFIRSECARGSGAVKSATVAKHFGSDELPQSAAAIVGIDCQAKTCTLEVNGQNGNGDGTYDYSLTAKRRVPGVDPAGKVPCTPVAPFAVPGYLQTFVQWERPVCDGGSPIVQYEVRDTPPGTTLLFDANTFSHTYLGLTNGVEYRYAMRARNSLGWSEWSVDSLAGVPAYSVPDPATVTSSTPGNKLLTITWSAPSSDGGKMITGYVIRATSENGDVVTRAIDGNVTTGVIDGLQNGINPDPASIDGAYTITVAAVNEIGEGRPSARFGPSVDTVPRSGPPQPPTTVTATQTPNTKGGATISWNEPLDDGGNQVTGYRVTSNEPSFVLKDITGNILTTNATNLPTGTPIVFYVQACNVSGCGTPSNGSAPLTLTFAPEQVTPAPKLRGTGVEFQAEVSFTTPESNGSNITGYEITLVCEPIAANCPGKGDKTVISSPFTTQVITAPSKTQSYRVTVAAINAAGTGPASAVSNSDIFGSVPQPPTDITTVATGIQGEIAVSFTAPTNTGGKTIDHYIVTVYKEAPAGTFTAVQRNVKGAKGDTSTTMLVGSLPLGQRYKVRVQTVVVNGLGDEYQSGRSGLSEPAVELTYKPNPPSSVNVTDSGFATGGYVDVTWTPGTQAAGTPAVTGYTLTCTNCPSPRSYSVGTSSPKFGVGGNPGSGNELPNGIPLTFTMRATNSQGDGGESAQTAPITLYGFPSAPTNVAATATGATGAVQVSWNAPYNGGKPITNYTVRIDCQTPCARKGATEAAGTATTHLVTGLTNGKEYTFKVTATNEKGTSVASLGATAKPVTNASAPVIGTAEATGATGTAIVRWTPPTDDGGSSLTGYRITASTGQTFDVTGGAATSYTATGLTDGTSTTFTVAAKNSLGTGSPSPSSNPVVTGTVPDAATEVTATATKLPGEIKVTWIAAPKNGPALTENTITVNCDCPDDGSTFETLGSATSYTVAGLVDGTTYTFAVTATNAFGEGPISDESNEASPVAPPTTPLDVTATRTSSSGVVIVAWDPPADLHGSAISSYTVVASTGAVRNAGTATSFAFNGLADGVAVSFRVRATNGAGQSPLSDPSNSVSPWGVPDAPVDVVATPTGVAGEVTVSWTVPADHSSPITGYEILGSDGTTTAVGPGSSALISGLSETDPISFVVRAINGAGDGAYSAPSAAVTPAGVPDAPDPVTATVTGQGEVTLDFAEPDGNGAAVTGYTVTIACSGGTCARNGEQAAITPGGTISGLGAGGTASFAVTATNSSGTGPAGTSNTVSIPNVPAAPTGVNAVLTGKKGQVTVNWTPADDGGSPITGYLVYSVNTSTGYTVNDGNATSFTLPRGSLPDGATVSFYVRAINAVGDSSNSASSLVVTTPVKASAPAAATITSVNTGTAGVVDVSWAPPANDGRSPIVSYTVTILATGGSKNNTAETTVESSPAFTTLRISGLTSGKTYTFRVASNNDVESGTRSGAGGSIVVG